MSDDTTSPDAPRTGSGGPGGSEAPPDDDVHGTEDATLGGYFRVHDRPPAFEGDDGHPYTVSIETEKTPNLAAPWIGFLVFPKWAETGVGIVGHVETPVQWEGRSREEVVRKAGALPLVRVKELLDEAVRRAADRSRQDDG